MFEPVPLTPVRLMIAYVLLIGAMKLELDDCVKAGPAPAPSASVVRSAGPRSHLRALVPDQQSIAAHREGDLDCPDTETDPDELLVPCAPVQGHVEPWAISCVSRAWPISLAHRRDRARAASPPAISRRC